LPEEWGGCNELQLLKNGKVGVLSHIAKYDEAGNRHYYSTVFCFDPENGEYSPMKIIAIRDNFKEGPSKREDIRDVIFSGGLVRKDGTAQLYCGVSDAQGHRLTIDDPFASFEKLNHFYKLKEEETMKMKKFTALFLAAAMTVSVVAGCGSGNGENRKWKRK